MAQLGVRGCGIGLIFAVIVGCGGRLGVADPAADDGGSDTGDHGIDSGTDTISEGDVVDTGYDGPPALIGWHSYTAIITDVKQTWTFGGGPTGGGSPPSKGWTGRIDLENGRDLDSGPKAVVLPAFASGELLSGTPGTTTTFTAPSTGTLLSVGGTMSGFYSVTDTYDSMTVTFGSNGRPTGAVLKGKSNAFSGDVGYTADTVATMTFAEDATKPKWKTTSPAAFAWVSLPWDEHTFEASEPYETAVSPEAWFGSTIDVIQHPIQSSAHGLTKERGLRFSLRNWDLSGSLLGNWNEVRDFADNASDAEAVAPKFDGAKVDKRDGTTWRADDGGIAPFVWGKSTVTTVGCRDGKSCLQIGPFPYSYCAYGSKGGLATRLRGNGTTEVAFRVVATPSPTFPGSGAPFFTDVVKMRVAVPSGDTADVSSALKWPTTIGSDGKYDTGWNTMSVSLGKLDAETGVAITGGGLGPDAGDSCGGLGGPPRPIDFDVTIYVEEIDVYGKK